MALKTPIDNLEIRDTFSFAPGVVVQRTKVFTFNYDKIQGAAKPTRVERGVFSGYSLPVYAADNEELSTCDCMPPDWDGVTDPVLAIGGWLSLAENTKKFNMQLGVETFDVLANAIVPDTSNDYPVETDTGNAAQYKSFFVQFTIDASEVGLLPSRPLGFRIRRIAATGNEIAGEFVVEGAMLMYYANKIGPKI